MDNDYVWKLFETDEKCIDSFFIGEYHDDGINKEKFLNDNIPSTFLLEELQESQESSSLVESQKKEKPEESNSTQREYDTSVMHFDPIFISKQKRPNFYLFQQPGFYQRKSFEKESRKCLGTIALVTNMQKHYSQIEGCISIFLVYNDDKQNNLRNSIKGNTVERICPIGTFFSIQFKICHYSRLFCLKFIISYKIDNDSKKMIQTEIVYSNPFYICGNGRQAKESVETKQRKEMMRIEKIEGMEKSKKKDRPKRAKTS